jgi:plastocyanin
MRHVRPLTTLLLLFASVPGCGGSSGSNASTQPLANSPPPIVPSGSNDVTVGNNVFAPGSVTIASGESVLWTWDACTGADGYGNAGTCVTHGIVFDDGTKSALQSEGTFTRTFATKGTYAYHCQIHGLAMAGTITVQ